MQSQFIKSCLALGAVGFAGSAFAGDTVRFDVNFSDIDLFYVDFAAGETPANEQVVVTGDPGRYVESVGFSNVDVDVCWNTGSSFTGWASEIVFDINLDDGDADGDGTDTAWYFVAPFAGDDTGSDVEGACANRQALEETDVPLTPFTLKVAATGDVPTGMSSTWNEGLGLRHSEVNTADFYFVLGGDIPAGCIGATGGCGEEHPTPGCDDVTCCSLTCELEPFCCDIEWDSGCVAIAIDACGIYEYSCDAPAYANDCATSPTMLSNGESDSYDTTLANYDGPEITCAGGGAANVWYMIQITELGAQELTASTCDAATYDTALTLWDAGEIGDVFDPANLEGAEIACNDDGGGCVDYTSRLIAPVTSGRQYLISVSGYQAAVGTGTLTVSWVTPDPQIPAQTCDVPGPDTASATNPGAVLQDNGVACAANNITTENSWARVYSAADLGSNQFTLDCVDFGIVNSGSYLEGAVNVWSSPTGNPAPLADLTLLASVPLGIYTGGADFSTAVLDGGLDIDLSDGSSIVIELAIPASDDGFAAIAGGTSADVAYGPTYLRSDSCGITEFGPYADIGFDIEWFVNLNGTLGDGDDCEGDFNDDGIVNGADFGSILAAWGECGGCPEDLSGDGFVSGADVGLLLSLWGNCPG